MVFPGYDASVMSPREYAEGWMNMMITIWKEKIREYDIYDTGTLFSSFEKDISTWTDEKAKGKIIHSFLLYGVYVERGHGREVSIGNDGDLGFTPKRIPKPWFAKKYLYSVFRFGEYFAANYGQEFCRMIRDTLEDKAGS